MACPCPLASSSRKSVHTARQLSSEASTSPARTALPTTSTLLPLLSTSPRISMNSRHVTDGVGLPVNFSGRFKRSSMVWKGIPSMFKALLASSTLRNSANANFPLARMFMMGFPSPRLVSTRPTSAITAPRNSWISVGSVPSTTFPMNSSRSGLVMGSTALPVVCPIRVASTSALALIVPAPIVVSVEGCSGLGWLPVSCCHVIAPVFTPAKVPGRSILRKLFK
mmetsp:Transcript_19629/g.40340  ORF Transcript_19629/g.40340 Transcript_19629/m.40340 type:complete len:224 (+) Transcript_19629:393-1064(+)